MEALKKRILQDGLIIDNRILKIDSFLNHQIDAALIMDMGREFARRFNDIHIDRIVTIETSGIAVALATAVAMGGIPLVFARKKKSPPERRHVYRRNLLVYERRSLYGRHKQALFTRRRTEPYH